MQSKAVLVLSTAFIFGCVSMVSAQTPYAVSRPARFTVGGDGVLSQPKGEFASNVGHGFGFNLNGRFNVDYRGYLSLRADAGGLQYGRERKDVSFFGITGRVDLQLETTNSIAWGSIGPQLMIPDGPFRPYANAAIAFTNFSTSSSLTDSFGQELASNQNQSDASRAWIFGGGVQIPVGSAGAVDLGARYYYGGRATYLTKGDIIDNPDGSITVTPRNSKTDMVLWQLGFSLALPQGKGH
jgi:Outer membrane protein beta-barrel domain